MTMINRRQILLGAGAGGILSVVSAGLYQNARSRESIQFLSAADTGSEHCLLGLGANGQLAYCLPVPYRAHDARRLDERFAIYLARRPGRHCYIVDMQERRVAATLTAEDGQHFCGHGVLDKEGHLLLTSYAFERQMGVVNVYEASAPFRKIREFDTHGLDPHQLAFLPDGETLVVANGGILTSEREMLDLDAMEPSLAYFDAKSGSLLHQVFPPHHQISLRHLAVASDGSVIVGAQTHTPGIEDSPHPLVFRHHMGSALQELGASPADWRSMDQYIASVAVSADGRFALTTTPRGSLVSLWSLESNRIQKHFSVRDVAGAAWVPEENSFLVSNGLGQLVYVRLRPEPHLELVAQTPQLQWDNHLVLI